VVYGLRMLFDPKDEAQGLVEYTLIFVLVSILGVATLYGMGIDTRAFYERSNESLSTIT
jgi:Flp pilus assembly pilin Flp